MYGSRIKALFRDSDHIKRTCKKVSYRAISFSNAIDVDQCATEEILRLYFYLSIEARCNPKASKC